MHRNGEKMKNRRGTKKNYLSYFLVFNIIISCFYIGLSQTPVKAATSGYCNANALYVRTGPGTQYDPVTVKGEPVILNYRQEVELIEKKDGWYSLKTTFNGVFVEGYSYEKYIETKESEIKKPEALPTYADGIFEYPGAVTAEKAKIYQTPSTKGTLLGNLKIGVEVTVLNSRIVNKEMWYLVSSITKSSTIKKEVLGYIKSECVAFLYLKPISAKIKTDATLVYTNAGSKKTVKDKEGKVISLSKSADLLLIAEETVNQAKWFKVSFSYKGEKKKGYIRYDQVKFVKTKKKVATPTPTQAPTPTPTSTPTPTQTPVPTASPEISSPSILLSGSNAILQGIPCLTVKQYADYSKEAVKTEEGTPILVYENQELEVIRAETGKNASWYYCRFSYKEKEYFGYLNPAYIKPKKNQTLPSVEGMQDNSSDLSFEKKLEKQGFPESYKQNLRLLHEKYPLWEFEAYHTGLDFQTAVEKESEPGKNLLYNTRGVEWKSLEQNAYDWKKDRFIVYDGVLWVTASKEAIAYYMDPRNFLSEDGIFQFEFLSYKPAYQTEEGVRNIFKETFMAESEYSTTDEFGLTRNFNYAQTFLLAAEYSGVSPFHLASRVKQEVVTGTSSTSSSVTGTLPGYEGYYNFYNIGAYHSTEPSGAVKNGLNYAKNGSSSSNLNKDYLIPWTNPFRSILGGAYYIGSTYINNGQNTLYLQKYNVTGTNTYSHQYMANAEAPYSEGKKIFTAYQSMINTPIVFSIPVYTNMPETASSMPKKALNPNNWLKTLEVFTGDGKEKLIITPTFDVSADQEYYLILENKKESIELRAEPVSKLATVSGNGLQMLSVGENIFKIEVTAENGDVRTYSFNVIREAE